MAQRLLAHRRDGYGGPKAPVFASKAGSEHTCASLLFEAGRNVKQVQAWLGHADPGFTLSTYIHLMDAGVGSAAFFDQAVGGGEEGGDIDRSRSG